MLDKSPLSIKEFKGIHVSDVDSQFTKYTQGDIPFANALDCVNLEFMKKGGLRTRNGIDTYETTFTGGGALTGKPVQMWKINNLKGTLYNDRWLILTWDGTNGRLYDTGVVGPATNPIMGPTATMKYAYVINAFGRMYIAPWKDWATPCTSFPSSDIHVYTGDYNARAAGGNAPAVGTFAAAIAAGGAVTVGLHYISVIFETDTGFRTTCPDAHRSGAPLAVTATAGNQTINLTNVPVGGAGTGVIKRHIIMTKVVTVQDGFLGNEPFIAVTINDNVTTTASIVLPDSALVDSANDNALKDVFGAANIYSCVSIVPYGNRLLYIGRNLIASANQIYINDIYVSPPNTPEHLAVSSPYQLGAVIQVGPYTLDKAITGGELDGVFYAFKSNSTYKFEENPDLDPVEWPVLIVDGGKGAYPFGVVGSGDNPGTAAQGFTVVESYRGVLLVAGNHGVSLFNGAFIDTPLSEFSLEEYTLEQRKWTRLAVDPIRNLIFIQMGEPYAAPTDHILVGNYYYGPTLGKIRWGKWNFTTNGGITPIWMAVRESGSVGTVGPTNDFLTNYPLLSLLTFSGAGPTYDCNILSETNRINDYARSTTGYWIPWLYETGYTPNEYGEVYTYTWLYLRALTYWLAGGNGGDASILAQFGKLDDSNLTTIGSFAPGATPGKYLQLPVNAVTEKLRIKISGTNRAFIQNLTLAIAERAKTRPI